MKVQYTLRIEAELLEQARGAAEREMRSLNNFIEVAVFNFVQRQDSLFALDAALEGKQKKIQAAIDELDRKIETLNQATH